MENLGWLLLTLRCLVGFIFIWYGTSKFLSPRANFERAIAGYRIMPARFVRPTSDVLPIVEVVLGTFLLLPFAYFPVSFGLLFLLLMFQAAIAKAFVTGLNISCGCNGIQEATTRHG